MAFLIRILNAFFAALFLVAFLISLGFLAAVMDGLARGPKGVGLAAGWAGLTAILALLCLANLRMAAGTRKPALVAANLAALLLTAAGLAVPDPAVRWIGGISLIPFAATSLALLLRPRSA